MPEIVNAYRCSVCGDEFDTEEGATFCEEFGKKVEPILSIINKNYIPAHHDIISKLSTVLSDFQEQNKLSSMPIYIEITKIGAIFRLDADKETMPVKEFVMWSHIFKLITAGAILKDPTSGGIQVSAKYLEVLIMVFNEIFGVKEEPKKEKAAEKQPVHREE